ncbi:polymer-forming cytoskeletal protein [Pedobacter sp.]|nr:polymer-forming cytoskeletal protein [Candidatus Saccharibacteria bacterium]
MGIKRKYGIAFIAAVMTVFVGTGIVSAASDSNRNYNEGAVVAVAQSETYDGALYAAGQSLTVAGTVKGDVYCAMQTVTITGTVEGDVICAAQNIRIDGTVKGDVRVAAQTASFGGNVDGTATVFAQTVDFSSNADIAGDLNGAAGSFAIYGTVGRDVLASAETMTIAGTVGRNVGGEYNQLTVTDNASVAGAVRYTSDKDATIASGVVKGEVARTAPVSNDANMSKDFFAGAAVYFFFSMLLVALVMVLIAPRLLRVVTDNGISSFLPSLLSGFFFVFGAPFLLGLIAVTVIGIPLAGIAFLVWLLVLLLSAPIFSYYLGRIIVRRQDANRFLVMLIGSTVLLLSYMIPILNAFTLLATVTIGSGMVVMAFFNRYKRPTTPAAPALKTFKTKKVTS